jgi:hypothetical protein
MGLRGRRGTTPLRRVHGAKKKGGDKLTALRLQVTSICLIRFVCCESYFTSIILLVSVKSPALSL